MGIQSRCGLDPTSQAFGQAHSAGALVDEGWTTLTPDDWSALTPDDWANLPVNPGALRSGFGGFPSERGHGTNLVILKDFNAVVTPWF